LAGEVVKEVPGNQIAQKLKVAMRETNQKHVRVMRTKAEHRALGYNAGIFYQPNLASERQRRSGGSRTLQLAVAANEKVMTCIRF
jgi:hypothetical protein